MTIGDSKAPVRVVRRLSAAQSGYPGGTSSQEQVGQHHDSGRVLPSCYRREPALAFDAGLFFTPAPTAAGSSSLSSSSSEWAASAALWLMPASASAESFSSAALSSSSTYFLIKALEHLLETLDLSACFLEVVFERHTQVG